LTTTADASVHDLLTALAERQIAVGEVRGVVVPAGVTPEPAAVREA